MVKLSPLNLILSTPVLLPGKSHGWRSLVGCSPWGHKESDTTERLHFHFSLSCIGEGNGNPLQCSCLENPRDGGAWWAAIYGVAQSRTQLKWLSSSSPLTEDTVFRTSHLFLLQSHGWFQNMRFTTVNNPLDPWNLTSTEAGKHAAWGAHGHCPISEYQQVEQLKLSSCSTLFLRLCGQQTFTPHSIQTNFTQRQVFSLLLQPGEFWNLWAGFPHMPPLNFKS